LIDWLDLLKNSLWVLGLSLGLAVISMARWEAQASQKKLKQILEQPGKQILLDLAGVFFCAGLATTSTRWWEVALWMILLALIIFQTAIEIRRRIGSSQTLAKDLEGRN
jgi:hypothetical protein